MTTAVHPVAPAARAATTSSRRSVQRLLGALGMLASPAFFVQWLAFPGIGAGVPAEGPVHSFIDLTYLVGFAACAIGIRRARATGHGRGAAVVFAIQMLGLVLAASQDVQDLAGVRPFGEAAYRATDAAWPLSHMYMLVVAVAVWRAKVWTGWRRWTPLACGLVVPAMLVAAQLGGRTAMGAVFCPGTFAAFLALGFAVWSARPAGDA
jgi:hypothetical protein